MNTEAIDRITINEKIKSELDDGKGYVWGRGLLPNELEEVKGFLINQWIDVITKSSPEHASIFKHNGIERYHELAHLVDHASLWTKSSRMFSKKVVDKILNMTLVRNLESIYGPIEIVDEENIGYEEIDWRLVRPNEYTDVGPFHADSWFLALGHGVTPPAGKRAIKIWVAIITEPGKNGLKVVPYSQKRSWRYHGEFRHGFVKPQIDEDESQLNAVLLPTQPGDVVIFHDDLLHAGALNLGQMTRVSMEFMAFVNQ